MVSFRQDKQKLICYLMIYKSQQQICKQTNIYENYKNLIFLALLSIHDVCHDLHILQSLSLQPIFFSQLGHRLYTIAAYSCLLPFENLLRDTIHVTVFMCFKNFFIKVSSSQQKLYFRQDFYEAVINRKEGLIVTSTNLILFFMLFKGRD